MSPAPALRLVTDADVHEAEQLLLRPFFAMAEAATEVPAVVRAGCRRPSVKRRRRAIASSPELIPHGPYRPRIEIIALPSEVPVFRLAPTTHVFHSPRVKAVVPSGRNRSYGNAPLNQHEYLEMYDAEAELVAAGMRQRRDGLLVATDADCDRIMASDAPCPYVRCRHNLRTDMTAEGCVQDNFPGKEVHELEETCSVRAARGGEMTTEEVAVLMNVTPERVTQIYGAAMRKAEDAGVNLSSIVDLIEDEWR